MAGMSFPIVCHAKRLTALDDFGLMSRMSVIVKNSYGINLVAKCGDTVYIYTREGRKKLRRKWDNISSCWIYYVRTIKWGYVYCVSAAYLLMGLSRLNLVLL